MGDGCRIVVTIVMAAVHHGSRDVRDSYRATSMSHTRSYIISAPIISQTNEGLVRRQHTQLSQENCRDAEQLTHAANSPVT